MEAIRKQNTRLHTSCYQTERHNPVELTSQARQSLPSSVRSPSTSFLKLVSLIQANENKKYPVKQGRILSFWNPEGRSAFFFRLYCGTQARRASPTLREPSHSYGTLPGPSITCWPFQGHEGTLW